MIQTRVIVVEPNGVKRSMPLTLQGLTIGRAPDNNLVINYPTTSRHHAQITFDGTNCFVTDFNSGNGTFMGDVQLAPNEPVIWPQNAPLQIGDAILQLEMGGLEQPQTQHQPSKPGRRSREITDTIPPGRPVLSQPKPQYKGVNLVWLGLLLLLGVFCACSILSTAGYFFFR